MGISTFKNNARGIRQVLKLLLADKTCICEIAFFCLFDKNPKDPYDRIYTASS